ncbi:TonB-dependent receptor [Roseateles sp. DAIF2]|uniref:TonB-dependent receptor n=1 Tax=Roseateles sp. DAIF2 TaxID=2714952 RepID=UPI0018A25D10|nr:TonB-dependent receptor [Roseateles sp. DAIF2]QPF75759.1 TonB-dependent receptor [Roseateles sp. DAIF2]
MSRKKINSSSTNKHHRPSATQLAVFVVLAMSQAAWAQSEAGKEAEKKEKSDRNELPQVVVTATRSKTDVMKTPVAVSAISGEDLVRDNIKEIRNLSGVVPNVQIGLSPSDSGVLMSIRGISSSAFSELADPAVGVHVDGVYSPRPQGALALMFDVENVEVLRGAQGTLFGRNSTAGVINVNPAKPDFKSDYGWSSLQLGNFNGRQFRSVYNKSLGDNFALRGAVMIDKRDGFVRQQRDLTDRGFRVSDGKGGYVLTPNGRPDVDQRLNKEVSRADSYGNSDQWAGRLSARWAISPQLEWQGAFDRFQNNGAGEILMRDCKMAKGTPQDCGSMGQWDAKINTPGKVDMTLDNWRSLLTWNITPTIDVQLRTAYSVQTRQQVTDTDGGLHPAEQYIRVINPATLQLVTVPGTSANPVDERSTHTFDSKFRSTVHELQLKQEEKNWRYVVGLFSLAEKNSILYALNDVSAGNLGNPTAHLYDQPDRRVSSRALFAQGDLKVLPKLTATLGIRQSWDTREDKGGTTSENYGSDGLFYYNGKFKPGSSPGVPGHNGDDLTMDMAPYLPISQMPNVVVGGGKHKANYKNFSYRLGLGYELDKNQMVYASVATAYRPGGFTDRTDRCKTGMPCMDPAMEPKRIFFRDYDEETTRNFELGYKGKLLDKKLDLGVTVFNTDFRGLHYTETQTFGAYVDTSGRRCAGSSWDSVSIGGDNCALRGWITTNIGKSTVRGIEIDYKALPWKGGLLSGYVSLLDSKIKEWAAYDDGWLCGVRTGDIACPPRLPSGAGSNPATAGLRNVDMRGKSLPRSPKYSFSVNYSHEFGLPNDLTLTPTVGYRWQSRMFLRALNLDHKNYGTQQDSYGMLNASVKLAANSGKWDVELWGTNLTDELVKNWLDNTRDASGIAAGFNPPRQYGVRATYYY